jgi:hypothetical protein
VIRGFFITFGVLTINVTDVFKDLDLMIDEALNDVYNSEFTFMVTSFKKTDGSYLTHSSEAFAFRAILENKGLIHSDNEAIWLSDKGLKIIESGGYIAKVEKKKLKNAKKEKPDQTIINYILSLLDSNCSSATNFFEKSVFNDLNINKDELETTLILMKADSLIICPYAGNNFYCVLTPDGLKRKKFGYKEKEKIVSKITNITFNNDGDAIHDSFLSKTDMSKHKNEAIIPPKENDSKSNRHAWIIGLVLAIFSAIAGAILNADKIRNFINLYI